MILRTELRLRCFHHFRPRTAFIHGEQLGDSHEFESFCEKRIKNLRHRRNRRRVDVMGQNDRPRPRSRDDALRNDVRARSLPIERINVPQDDFVAEVVIYQYALPFRQLAIRRAHQPRFYTCGLHDNIFGPLKLGPNALVREFRKVRVRPGVIADFVSFRNLSPENVWVLLDAFAKDKEGEFDVPLRCHLQQRGCVRRVRAVIERHRDVWPLDVHVGEGNFLCDDCGGRWRRQCAGRVLCVDDRWQNEKERRDGKSKADHLCG